MVIGDVIQSLILAVLSISVLMLVLQTRLQNRLLRAQLLRDRLDMYWKTYEPVTDEHVREFNDYPEDYMHRQLYERSYKGHPEAIRRYIYMSMLYEYLAFTYGLKTLSIGDPLGYHWTRRWTRDLSAAKEFQDVHEQYRGYYPHYEAFVDQVLREEESTTERLA